MDVGNESFFQLEPQFKQDFWSLANPVTIPSMWQAIDSLLYIQDGNETM